MDIHEAVDLLRELILLEDQSFYSALIKKSELENRSAIDIFFDLGDPRQWLNLQ